MDVEQVATIGSSIELYLNSYYLSLYLLASISTANRICTCLHDHGKQESWTHMHILLQDYIKVTPAV